MLKLTEALVNAIYTELKQVTTDKNLTSSKVMGLATDGAWAMTDMGEGLTGYLTRDNHMLVNFHCIAHRFALAADSVPYLVDYQCFDWYILLI